MRIAVTQFKARDIADFEEFAAHVEWHIEGAVWQKADFVLFPEYFSSELLSAVPGARDSRSSAAEAVFDKMGRNYTESFHELFTGLAKRNSLHIVAGTHFYYNVADQKFYNASLLFTPDGRVHEQRKTHRAYELVHNRHMVTPGDALPVFETDLGRVGITICYDCAFPETARSMALRGAEVIFNPACVFNLYGVRRMRTYSAARAIENQCFVANSQVQGDISFPADDPIHFEGQSAIFTPADPAFGPPDGIAVEGTLNVEQVLSADVDIEALRQYRKEGMPAMLQERRPELYADLTRIRR
jgi:predicted amidohydrolase